MKKIKIAYHLLLLSFAVLIFILAGALIFSAYAKKNETLQLSEKIKGLLEYVSVKQVDQNAGEDLAEFLSETAAATTTLKINPNPFKIFSQEEESAETIISPSSSPEINN